jgi:hypothetical protein
MSRPLAVLLLLYGSLAPGRVFAQAEPAPEDHVPPNRSTPLPPTSRVGDEQPKEPPPKWRLSIDPRLAVELGGTSGLPRVGYGAGGEFSRALVQLGRLRFGVGFSFGFERFSHDKAALGGAMGSESMTLMTFAARGVFDALFHRLRPFLAIGAGLSVGTYTAPPSDAFPLGVDVDSVLPLVQLAAGLGIEIWKGIELGLHSQLDFTFSSAMVGGVQPYQLGSFGAGLDIGFRF